MSAEHRDHWKGFGKTLRVGGVVWIVLAAAGVLTGAALAKLVLAGAVGSVLGSAIENKNKFFGSSHETGHGGGH